MSRFFSPTLSNLEPYTPGEQPQDRSYVKLNTNESPYPPAPAVLEAIQKETGRLQLYPDPACTAPAAEAADYYGLQPDQIMAGNGSDENLFFALRALTRDLVYLSRYHLRLLRRLVRAAPHPEDIIPLEADFSLDPLKYHGRNETIVIANPNAPTGLALPPEAIGAIADANPTTW